MSNESVSEVVTISWHGQTSRDVIDIAQRECESTLLTVHAHAEAVNQHLAGHSAELLKELLQEQIVDLSRALARTQHLRQYAWASEELTSR